MYKCQTNYGNSISFRNLLNVPFEDTDNLQFEYINFFAT